LPPLRQHGSDLAAAARSKLAYTRPRRARFHWLRRVPPLGSAGRNGWAARRVASTAEPAVGRRDRLRRIEPTRSCRKTVELPSRIEIVVGYVRAFHRGRSNRARTAPAKSRSRSCCSSRRASNLRSPVRGLISRLGELVPAPRCPRLQQLRFPNFWSSAFHLFAAPVCAWAAFALIRFLRLKRPEGSPTGARCNPEQAPQPQTTMNPRNLHRRHRPFGSDRA